MGRCSLLKASKGKKPHGRTACSPHFRVDVADALADSQRATIAWHWWSLGRHAEPPRHRGAELRLRFEVTSYSELAVFGMACPRYCVVKWSAMRRMATSFVSCEVAQRLWPVSIAEASWARAVAHFHPAALGEGLERSVDSSAARTRTGPLASPGASLTRRERAASVATLAGHGRKGRPSANML